MRMMGMKVRSRHVDKFMKRYDVNGDGSISFEEFSKYYLETIDNNDSCEEN
jgi:Ca2+-binding EF-hand superfamily protein